MTESPLKVLFIGNSATYVHEIPQTLSFLSTAAGFPLTSAMLTKGGYELAQHADASTDHGKRVSKEIARGYDVVFLQDNGNCITTEEKQKNTVAACQTLSQVIRATNALPYIYVRPPYGKPLGLLSPLEQCRQFDALFSNIADEQKLRLAYANRAFASAIKNTDYPLWGPDNAHTSPHGAYLIVCVLFATLFQTSASVLGTNGIPEKDARELQRIADEIVLQGIVPW
ncbi:MAG: hypothetical protein E7637_03515 [Ruminococcaceae bacterium]|nr:hypothetical protein [Oscillospiraceae bacterium]